MKQIYNKAEQQRSVRRLIRQWFSSFVKHHNCRSKRDTKKIIQMLQEIEDSIEIIARQVARWAKIEPGD
jgi:hypothetical protein